MRCAINSRKKIKWKVAVWNTLPGSTLLFFFIQTVGRSMNPVAIQCNAFFSMWFDSRETTKDQRYIEKNGKYNFITKFNPFACAFSRHNCIFGTEIRDWVPLWNFYTNDIDDDFGSDNKVGSYRSSGATLLMYACTYLRVTIQSASHFYKTFNQIYKTHNFRIKMKRFSKYTRCDLNL